MYTDLRVLCNNRTQGRIARSSARHQARRTTIGQRYATDRNLTEHEEITSKYESRMEDIQYLRETYTEEVEGLLQQLDERGLGDLAERVRRRTTPRGRARAGAVVGRAIQARVEAGTALVGEQEIGNNYAIAARLPDTKLKPVPIKIHKAGRFGTLARRMFGGFGLLYMRSIAGLMTTGAYTGYAERLQTEQAMAQPLLAAGGEMPETPADRLQRVQAVQYGGKGGMALTQGRLMLMEKSPVLYNAFTLGLSGVSAAGMATWMLGPGGMGMTARAAGGWGLAIGAGTMLAASALSGYGAWQDVNQTAMAQVYKQMQGQPTAEQAIARNISVFTGAGAAIGGLIGGIAGAPGGPPGIVAGALALGAKGAAIGLGIGVSVSGPN
jgi:hypothetical protein